MLNDWYGYYSVECFASICNLSDQKRLQFNGPDNYLLRHLHPVFVDGIGISSESKWIHLLLFSCYSSEFFCQLESILVFFSSCSSLAVVVSTGNHGRSSLNIRNYVQQLDGDSHLGEMSFLATPFFFGLRICFTTRDTFHTYHIVDELDDIQMRQDQYRRNSRIDLVVPLPLTHLIQKLKCFRKQGRSAAVIFSLICSINSTGLNRTKNHI